MILRDYQTAAVNACWQFISEKPGNPCIVLPTGAGKSLVLAQLAHDAAINWGGRVIILAHVKELLEQNCDKLKKLSPDLDIGVYSAGLNKRERRAQVLVAGIQSVYQRATEFEPFDLIIVDEAHLLPPDGEGMYRQFLMECRAIQPHVRLIGLTATPYRMQTGWLCGYDNLLNEVCYEVGIKELVNAGWLSKLISKEAISVDTSSLHVRGGEFIPAEAEQLMNDVIKPACEEILKRTESRTSVLVFCQSIAHAVDVVRAISERCLSRVELVTGDTPAAKRAEIIRDFKAKSIKYLVNVNVLTTGFDAPNVDCVCLLRPTMSPGLYYQMVGRGFRTCDGKNNCLVLDFAGNVKKHGPIDQIVPKPTKSDGTKGDAPTKVCAICQTVCHTALGICPDCGFVFPERELAKHDTQPGSSPITTMEVIREDHRVLDVKYNVHIKRDATPDTPKTLRVEYKVNPIRWVSEWVCFEHEGYAGNKARLWWRARSNDPFPASAEQAAILANAGALAIPETITIAEKGGEKFPRIVKVTLGPKPDAVEADGSDDFSFPAGDPVTDETTIDWSTVPW